MAGPEELNWAHPLMKPGQIEWGGRGGGDGNRHPERKKKRVDRRSSKEFHDDRKESETYKFYDRLLKGLSITYVHRPGTNSALVDIRYPQGSSHFTQSISPQDKVFPFDVKHDSRLEDGTEGIAQFRWKDRFGLAIIWKMENGETVTRNFKMEKPKTSFFYPNAIQSLTKLCNTMYDWIQEE